MAVAEVDHAFEALICFVVSGCDPLVLFEDSTSGYSRARKAVITSSQRTPDFF
jgi:hypothetical protein